MAKPLRLHMRTLVLTALLTLGLGAAGATEHSAAAGRTISITGTGTVSVAPDIARINMAVVERNGSVTAAQQAAAAVTNKVLAILDKLGIAREQINTTGAMIRPDYRWDRAREQQELVGYVVERNVRVELRELDKLGALVEQVSAAGINQLSPPTLDSSTRRKAYREALALAVSDARQNAATIAAATGGTLGNAISIGTGAVAQPVRPMLRAQADMAMAAESVQESFTPGAITFTANINALYELNID